MTPPKHDSKRYHLQCMLHELQGLAPGYGGDTRAYLSLDSVEKDILERLILGALLGKEVASTRVSSTAAPSDSSPSAQFAAPTHLVYNNMRIEIQTGVDYQFCDGKVTLSPR